MVYDLEARTTQFGKEVLKVIATIPETLITRPILSQLVRASISVGANYREANGASSKNDFRNKIYICRKEIQETKYWLEILASTNPPHVEEIRKLWKEAHEITLIFNKISSTLNKKQNG